ncbi:MAG: Hsp20/alpha crystallin family protein [Bacteroidota bacterium]
MSLIRWNPIRESATLPSDFFGIQREINRVFDNFFRGGMQDDGTLGFSMWTPAVDIAEHENDYVVNVELPGVSKDDVKITLESNILTIRGEKKQEKESKDQSLHRVERSYGAFQRSFTLPTTVKNERIDAVFNDGILTVTLPKAEEAKPKQIEVKVK